LPWASHVWCIVCLHLEIFPSSLLPSSSCKHESCFGLVPFPKALL
jgi:hypothetical protein